MSTGRLAASSRHKATLNRTAANVPLLQQWRTYEGNPNLNRGTLVQVDAQRYNVALARPLRMPDVRAAPPGLLGVPTGVAHPGAGRRRREIHTSVDSATRHLLMLPESD